MSTLNATYTGSYTKEQQIHSLSLLANAAFGKSFPTFKELQTYTTTVVTQALANNTPISPNTKSIQSLIGNDWQLVWGPVVYSKDPTSSAVVADNTMMLVYSPSQNLYVIAIAGTNINSMYGWFNEDFMVDEAVLWSDVLAGIPADSGIPTDSGIGGLLPARISLGSYTGLNVLLKHMKSGGQSIIDSLTAALASTPKAEIAVAGHSLGGALSPVLALYLYDTQSSSNWNTKGNASTISAWPTAGPTPGSDAFANYYAEKVKEKPGSGKAAITYTSKYNTLDVIPQAWQRETIAGIPGMYKTNIPAPQPDTLMPEPITGTLALSALLNSYVKNMPKGSLPMLYKQVSPWTPMTGQFDPTTDANAVDLIKNGATWAANSRLIVYWPHFKNLVRFIAQMGYQHTDAYNILLAVTDFAAELKSLKAQIAPGQQTEEEAHANALSVAVGAYLGVKNVRLPINVHIGLPDAISAVEPS